MSKCPYTYPHRSKAAQIEYLVAHTNRNSDHHWWPLVWDVKFYSANVDGIGTDYPIRRWLDDRWAEYRQENCDELWSMVVENMQDHYVKCEYTTWPGDDQGDWAFCFFGRSGGWMRLDHWKSQEMHFVGTDDWREWLEEQPAERVRTLYRAVICMDQDFQRNHIEAEFAYQMHYRRHDWESTLHIDPLVDAMRTALWNKAQQDKIALELKAKGVTA
jgi:hypothetical protein